MAQVEVIYKELSRLPFLAPWYEKKTTAEQTTLSSDKLQFTLTREGFGTFHVRQAVNGVIIAMEFELESGRDIRVFQGRSEFRKAWQYEYPEALIKRSLQPYTRFPYALVINTKTRHALEFKLQADSYKDTGVGIRPRIVPPTLSHSAA